MSDHPTPGPDPEPSAVPGRRANLLPHLEEHQYTPTVRGLLQAAATTYRMAAVQFLVESWRDDELPNEIGIILGTATAALPGRRPDGTLNQLIVPDVVVFKHPDGSCTLVPFGPNIEVLYAQVASGASAKDDILVTWPPNSLELNPGTWFASLIKVPDEGDPADYSLQSGNVVQQVAECGLAIEEHTVRRWSNLGLLPVDRSSYSGNPGGHRRYPADTTRRVLAILALKRWAKWEPEVTAKRVRRLRETKKRT
jgi:hypothetical protein